MIKGNILSYRWYTISITLHETLQESGIPTITSTMYSVLCYTILYHTIPYHTILYRSLAYSIESMINLSCMRLM